MLRLLKIAKGYMDVIFYGVEMKDLDSIALTVGSYVIAVKLLNFSGP